IRGQHDGIIDRATDSLHQRDDAPRGLAVCIKQSSGETAKRSSVTYRNRGYRSGLSVHMRQSDFGALLTPTPNVSSRRMLLGVLCPVLNDADANRPCRGERGAVEVREKLFRAPPARAAGGSEWESDKMGGVDDAYQNPEKL